MKNFMCLQELLGRCPKQLQYFDQDMAFYAYVRITKAQSGDHYLIGSQVFQVAFLSVIGMTMFRVYSKFSCWKICSSLRAASKTGRT